MEKQFIVFKLNDYKFMADIMDVVEIINYREPTYVPNAPSFISGIIKNRGVIVPIVDLKKRFHLEQTSNININKKIAVIQVDEIVVGLIVDDITEIIVIDDNNIKDVPEIVKEIDKKYIIGSLEYNDQLILVFNLREILSRDEKEMIKEIG
ncbi:purine-binding chemotaxis protein CheW [Caldanaerobius fijiensis DSM 17918]|uniref:Purine-binding chemotaxis protein CheW n=1 Tax=Caldanaerobius fijiensis DSM 17918 TaxID=1121256 RepID=A0A1M4TW74_9THEO|nr:chemotaxis protein CheW [Caldanaerobius fijiensis]SHE48676.1 purine-binding chemotaxis protein CheW [Caldanaerobius fijiensis DSM 17918]